MKLMVRYLAVCLGFAFCPLATYAESENNIQIMTDAARHLSWEAWQGNNRAYLLVKQETILAPVAVIFGYADNGTACEALAQSLSKPLAGVGTFKCQPIF